MKRALHMLRIYLRRLSFRWVLVCMVIILPINVLAVVYSTTLYHHFMDKIHADHEIQIAGFANDLSKEMSRISQSLNYSFSSDSFGQLLTRPVKDSSMVAVACKNLIATIRGDSEVGLSYAWDRTNEIVYVFHNNNHYSLETQRAFEDWILSNGEVAAYSHVRNAAVLSGQVFLGVTHHFRDFSIGIYTDVGKKLEEYYQYATEPKGSLGIMDENGVVIAALNAGIWRYGEEAAFEIQDGFLAKQPLDSSAFFLFQQLDRAAEKTIAGSLPIIFWALIGLTLVGFAAMPLIFVMSDRLLIHPVSKLLHAMEELGRGNLDLRLPERAKTIDVEFMNKGFNRMAEEIQDLRIKTYEQEIEQLKTDAINLKLQVNPHMFLNSLNTIYSLGRVGKTQELCDFSVLLMQYFRLAFRSDAEFGTVKEEMDFVASYMKIQAIRFPGSFSYAFVMEPQAEGIQIPRFIIENFAENVVKYALQSERETEIIIQARVQEDRLFISIIDDGCGIDESTLEQIRSGSVVEDSAGRHTGIWNSRRRLDFYYGDQYELSINSALGKGTQVFLCVPHEPVMRNAKPHSNDLLEANSSVLADGESLELEIQIATED